MASYDSAVFERSQEGFALSQRFRHLCSQFSGTVKLFMQMIFTNTLLRSVPRSVGHLLLIFYLLIVIFLFFLLEKQGSNQTNRGFDDPDLLVATKYMLRDKKQKRSIGGILITVFAFLFIANLAEWSQRMAIVFINIHFIVALYFIYRLFQDEF